MYRKDSISNKGKGVMGDSISLEKISRSDERLLLSVLQVLAYRA